MVDLDLDSTINYFPTIHFRLNLDLVYTSNQLAIIYHIS